MKAIDAITLFGRASKQIIFEHKERLRSALWEDYRSICDQDNSTSKFLLGDDLAGNIRKAKATSLLNQSISAKKQTHQLLTHHRQCQEIPQHQIIELL